MEYKVELGRETTEEYRFSIVVRVDADSPEEARRYVEERLGPGSLPDINEWTEIHSDVVGEDTFWVAEVSQAAEGEDLSGHPEVIDEDEGDQGEGDQDEDEGDGGARGPWRTSPERSRHLDPQ